MVERQPSKLRVAGSNPVSRSIANFAKQSLRLGERSRVESLRSRMDFKLLTYNFSLLAIDRCAHVAQLAEHILGKDEVTGSIPVMGSRKVVH